VDLPWLPYHSATRDRATNDSIILCQTNVIARDYVKFPSQALKFSQGRWLMRCYISNSHHAACTVSIHTQGFDYEYYRITPRISICFTFARSFDLHSHAFNGFCAYTIWLVAAVKVSWFDLRMPCFQSAGLTNCEEHGCAGCTSRYAPMTKRPELLQSPSRVHWLKREAKFPPVLRGTWRGRMPQSLSFAVR